MLRDRSTAITAPVLLRHNATIIGGVGRVGSSRRRAIIDKQDVDIAIGLAGAKQRAVLPEP